MKVKIKRLVCLGVFIILAIQIGFVMASDGQKLTYKETLWASLGNDNRLVVVSDGIFRRGEDVNLVIRDVGKFIEGADGKYRFDIDMVVKNSANEIVLEQDELLGENGHCYLKDGIAASPYGIYKTKVDSKPGNYQMFLTIYDIISGSQVTIKKIFTLSAKLSYEKAIFAKRGENNQLEPVTDAVFSRGEIVNFVLFNVGTFEKGPEGKHSFDIDMEVTDTDGKVIFEQKKLLGEKGNILLDKDIAASPYGIFYTNIKMDAGRHLMKLIIRDNIANDTLNVTRYFTLK